MTQQEKQSIKDFLNKNPNASAEDVKKVIDGTVVASKTLPQNEKRKILNTSFEIEDNEEEILNEDSLEESDLTTKEHTIAHALNTDEAKKKLDAAGDDIMALKAAYIDIISNSDAPQSQK